MSYQEKQQLEELVQFDLKQVGKFLNASNIKVKNKITMLFSDGDVDESKLDQLPFFVDQVSTFARAVLNNEEVPITLTDGLSALRVARAALKSVQSGQVIILE